MPARCTCARRALLAAVLLGLAAGLPRAEAAAAKRAKHRLKMASLAPEGSAWMRTFNEIDAAIVEATAGEVGLKAYPGGVLGEEKDVLFKIKVGQVDGGGFLGAGMSKICPDARAMMLPMLFEDYAEVDAVFAKVQPYLEAQCEQNEFVALGWTEVGFSLLYSAVPVRTLEDLRGAKPWQIPGDDIMRELFAAGRIGGIPVPVSDVLTGLQTGLIRTVFAPPLAAVATQWFTRVKYRSSIRLSYSYGGLFVSRKSWQGIPESHRPAVLRISHEHLRQLTEQVRKSNEDALDVMARNNIQVSVVDPAAVAEFQAIGKDVVARITGTVFSTQGYEMVRRHLDEFRAARAAK